VKHAYNSQSQLLLTDDQATNVLENVYDTSGRETARRVATRGSGFDGAVMPVLALSDAKQFCDYHTQPRVQLIAPGDATLDTDQNIGSIKVKCGYVQKIKIIDMSGGTLASVAIPAGDPSPYSRGCSRYPITAALPLSCADCASYCIRLGSRSGLASRANAATASVQGGFPNHD